VAAAETPEDGAAVTANKRVTVTECCRRLGCDQPILRALLMSGRIPYVRKRGRLLIKVSDLDKYLDDVRADRPPGVTDDD
jgi:excisionase family DNA binding protein